MWSVYEKPDGSEVEVWHIVDSNEIPGGNVASPGQVLVREMRDDPDNPGQKYRAEYFLDAVRPDWTLLSDLPDTVPANEPIPAVEDPRADLWRMGADGVKRLAAKLGVSAPEGEEWLLKDWIYAVHEARLTADEGDTSQAPEDQGEPPATEDGGGEPASADAGDGEPGSPSEGAEVIAGMRVGKALKAVGDDAEMAAAVKAVEEAKGDDARTSLIEGLDQVIAAAAEGDDG